MEMAMERAAAALLLLLVLTPVPSSAQTNPQQPTREYRGLFGPATTKQVTSGRTLDVFASAEGGLDDRVAQRGADGSTSATPGRLPTGFYAAGISAVYERFSSRTSMSFL